MAEKSGWTTRNKADADIRLLRADLLVGHPLRNFPNPCPVSSIVKVSLHCVLLIELRRLGICFYSMGYACSPVRMEHLDGQHRGVVA